MPRTGVQFIKNDEPSFIRQFKQKIGHKDEADVDTKRQIPDFDNDGEEEGVERDDEKPVIVVVKKGDLTAEEVEEVEKEIDEGPAHLDQKITFKKPTKRSSEEDKKKGDGDGGEDGDSPAAAKASKKEKKKEKKKDKDSGNKLLKKKNTSLLSFGDEEEED